MTQEEYLKAERAQAWREKIRRSKKNKERTEILRAHMNEVDAKERIRSQSIEVNTGLTAEQALTEASRCLDCANPTCVSGCPVNINIPKFIKCIEVGNVIMAGATLKESSALPSVCGRVCPQEKQCEANCFYSVKINKPSVAIGNLERYAADYCLSTSTPISTKSKPRSNGIKVAAIGAGPASLSFAGDMAQNGYDVTVFEALHEVGGVLKYGIPEFRLPNMLVDKELKNLENWGVKFVTNFIVGRTASFEQLEEEGYQAFFIGSGAGLPRFMNIEGENLNGILSANEYLTRVNLMNAQREDYDTPVLLGKNVAVVGGGNTAMDAVRTAKRLGADRAMIIYRRSMEEMPARQEEIKHAQEEGVEFINLANPVRYEGNELAFVDKMFIQQMELGEPDASGRRKPISIEGSEVMIEVDTVVVAVGVSPNPLIPLSLPKLQVSKWGTVEADKHTLQSSIPNIFAGGDIVRGGATVIQAMGDGKRAAKGMHNYLNSVHGVEELRDDWKNF
ncbi:MAG: NADPH-dependent glutamate synthase [Bacteroidales bacterium]